MYIHHHTKDTNSFLLFLQLNFPKAKLLLMSNNQQDLNDWFQSLNSAVG